MGTRFFQLTVLLVSLASTKAVESAPPPATTPTTASTAAKRPTAPVKAPPAPAPTTRAPSAVEIADLARSAITNSGTKMPKGATIVGARATADAAIPNGATKVTIELTPPPRRVGKVVVSGVLSFWKESDIAGRLPVSLELSVPPEALVFDVAKGASVTLVVQRGDVEVSAPAVAGSEGDVGDVVQVLLRPSGRAFRARLLSKDRALAVEDAR
ncbi:MAG: flagella basal body P-ring formation protein FlgA [Deltaproteobacteria bacterium]|nr:flagella basal body P-ring formation protein FlgA [Deltaproteobacteria bacterium]